MTNSYPHSTWVRGVQKAGLVALLAGGTALAAQAQALNYTATTAANVAGTYADVSAVAGSAAIATANTDDANSAATPIGFTFTFNGTAFTEFVLNTNGLLRLGSAAPSSAAAFPTYAQTPELGPISGTNAADVNLIAPFNLDLFAGTAGGTEYRVATTGTAPNRVCTIQWKNVADKPQATSGSIATVITTQYANFSFQVKLYETTNTVEFVYGAATAGTGTDNPKYAAVGLKGATPTASLVATKGSTGLWSTAVFAPGPYLDRLTGNGHNIRQTALPDAGRTYRFAPTPNSDAGVAAIYTLGKIASPGALPHAVRAVITNSGLTAQTNLDVALNVTGANTFTDTKRIASLAVGASATVTFAAYPATLVPGTNAVTVTLPADGNTANNSATYGQLVTTNRISYTDPAQPLTLGVGAGNAIFASKYTLPAATVLSDVVVTFNPTTGTAVNTAPYQVVIYDATAAGGLPGQVLYTSATQNRTSAGGAVTIPVPNVAVPASFFIGVKETSATNMAIAYQVENPIRPATFYFTTDGAVWNDFATATPKARFAIEFGTTVPNCAAPTAVAVSNIGATGATVTFTPPATGAASYELVYGPTGFNPVAGGTSLPVTASPVALTNMNPATVYQVYVRSVCSAGGTSSFAPVVSFATLCNPNPAVSAFPYAQNFDTVLPGQTLPCGITVLNANNDATTWAVSNVNPNSGTNSMRYRGLVLNNVAADDWFFTPPLTLLGTSRYQVAFRYRGEGIANSPSDYTESLEVKSGTAPTVAAQTNLLFSNAAITNTNYALANGTSTPVVALLPLGAGTQYVGFHVNSTANQGNLYIDDIAVTATAISASSEALLRAVSVFPNPSATGLFDLEIHGANAGAGLGVQVTNTLGQRVYTGSARDNYTNKLDLSGLAPGIYYLQVRNGDEHLTSQLSIVK
ncbi:T9SS type A sorting domain-containing protein [Hymenobacter armeniacus]|uniref:T9SS type A sorting domain-containing protein n=1 Tax=Hymenobacter armeniacus TaxID=2771358 RepID=A0ABR8JTA6_9BACT|nr:T9SS type A sorting domain-containing protein [Hymenobacter armeniacus]MBD2723214.1 T9SS type A sorting domain-containing protein [Hymenobacter armeniacus]